MIDTAIVVCPQDGLREEALLGLDLERFGGPLRGQGQLQVVPWEGMDPETIRSAGDVPGAAVLGVTGSFLVVLFWTLRGGRNASGEPSQRAAETMMAIGSNLYWMAWLALCGLPRRSRPSAG
ncbi:MAG: hypothetical protein H6Q86_2484 [candidate division NC10 bacterium]|jgi:hypothetical protein|nr:hypothetical protein [candidate division NC10 bacterium]